jgi:hypothetical protein
VKPSNSDGSDGRGGFGGLPLRGGFATAATSSSVSVIGARPFIAAAP